MSWVLCTSGSAVAKAGVHCSSISGSATFMAKWSDEAEGYIEIATNTAWVSNYASLGTGIKGIVGNVCAALIAQEIIKYDTTGYLTREADTLLNVNDEIITKGIKMLEGKSGVLKTP